MEITITKHEDAILASIEGRVDTTTAKDFEIKVAELLSDECANIILDCEKMNYVSSSGLRGFLILQKGINAKKGKLVLQNMSAPVYEIFKITGFSTIFNITT